MKLGLLCLTVVLLLTGCGKSDQALAKDLVVQSCGSHNNEETERLIRQAVQLDETYRPYLIAWLKWQNGVQFMKGASAFASDEVFALAYKDFKDNYAIQDSYCS